MKYTVGFSGHFDAAHFLKDYDGECSNIHGHSWRVDICVSSLELDQFGMIVDFKALKEHLNKELKRYDHKLINDIYPFTDINPTAENLAYDIYMAFKKELMSYTLVTLESVTVWESESCYARYE